MLYDKYQEKISRTVQTLAVIRRFRVLILTVLITAVVLAASFLLSQGAIYGDEELPDTLVYGEEMDRSAKALFSNVRYEYRTEGSTEWTEAEPVRAGTYYVRR